jgi:hypothetical protein
MTKAVAYPILVVSALGAIICLVFQVVGFDDVLLEKRAVFGLFGGVALVWLPTISLTKRLAPNLRKRLIWKGVFRGCPRWMRVGLPVLLACLFCGVLVLTFRGYTRLGPPAASLLAFAGFYSVSFCVTYSALHAEGIGVDRDD